MPHVLVWHLETVPDLKGMLPPTGMTGNRTMKSGSCWARNSRRHIFHSIVCIGALIARREGDHWTVEALGASPTLLVTWQ